MTSDHVEGNLRAYEISLFLHYVHLIAAPWSDIQRITRWVELYIENPSDQLLALFAKNLLEMGASNLQALNCMNSLREFECRATQ